MINNIYKITFNHEDEYNIIHTTNEIIKSSTKETALIQLKKLYDEDEDLEILNIEREPNIGLAVMRMQPLHKGHFALIVRMLEEMDLVIIGLGSIQESKTLSNPFTPKQRREMIEQVFGKTGKSSKIKIVELKDIGACNPITWSSFVFGKIDGMNLPTPNHYYAGSNHDADWFNSINEEFGTGTLDIHIVDRLTETICMSATEIRKSIISGSTDWLEYTPTSVSDYIINNFPSELLLQNNIDVGLEKEKFEKLKKVLKK
jgi:cytidyltransferase-like protein